MMASNWKSYGIEDGWCRVALPGVYAIYGDGALLYIGESVCVGSRLANHNISWARYSSLIDTPWGQFQTVNIKIRRSRKFGDWAMIEKRLIRRLKPPQNIFGKSERMVRRAQA